VVKPPSFGGRRCDGQSSWWMNSLARKSGCTGADGSLAGGVPAILTEPVVARASRLCCRLSHGAVVIHVLSPRLALPASALCPSRVARRHL
jgi:hypothetical protein